MEALKDTVNIMLGTKQQKCQFRLRGKDCLTKASSDDKYCEKHRRVRDKINERVRSAKIRKGAQEGLTIPKGKRLHCRSNEKVQQIVGLEEEDFTVGAIGQSEELVEPNVDEETMNRENELHGEGLTADEMLGFSNVACHTKFAEIDGPKSFLVSKLDALEAEENKVQQQRAKVQSLLNLKEAKEQLEDKFKELDKRIFIEKSEEDSLKIASKRIEEDLCKLEESRAGLAIEQRTNCCRIAELQEQREGIKREMESIYSEFGRISSELA